MAVEELQQLDRTFWRQAIEGALDLVETDAGIQPHRIPMNQRRLFEPDLFRRTCHCAGIRLTLVSDTGALVVQARRGADDDMLNDLTFDLLIDGQFHGRQTLADDSDHMQFDDLPEGEHRLELYLPQAAAVLLQAVLVDADATVSLWDDPRPKWLVYGSSITQCKEATGPSETWPALVAQAMDWNLTCLGYGGNCKLEPMVARMIAGQPADFISLCLGINVHNIDYSPRTFRAAVLGVIAAIRDGHPDTPMVCVSPIISGPRETTPGTTGMTLVSMREQVADAVDALGEAGDDRLAYADGLELFGPEHEARHMPDELHPDAEGYRVLAQRYREQVIPKLTKMIQPITA